MVTERSGRRIGANLVVADFSATDEGVSRRQGTSDVPDSYYTNEAKAFKCSEKALQQLKRYE